MKSDKLLCRSGVVWGFTRQEKRRLTREDESEIDADKNNVIPRADIGKGHGGDFGNDKVEQPGGAGGYGCYRHTNTQRSDFSGVQKGEAEITDGEEEGEDVDEGAGHDDSGPAVWVWCCACHNGHADAHAEGGEHQQFPSAVPINCHHAHGCAECLPGEDAGGDDTGVWGVDAQVFMEDGGLIESERIHAAHLLA